MITYCFLEAFLFILGAVVVTIVLSFIIGLEDYMSLAVCLG